MNAVQPAGAIETIAPKVEWKKRKNTDVICGAIYMIGLLIWLGIGFTFMGSATELWEYNDDNHIVGYSAKVKEMAQECCSGLAAKTDTTDTEYNNNSPMCWMTENRRHLHETEADPNYLGHRKLSESGTFPSDGKMLDVYAIHPHVALVMIFTVLAMAIGWILTLKKVSSAERVAKRRAEKARYERFNKPAPVLHTIA